MRYLKYLKSILLISAFSLLLFSCSKSGDSVSNELTGTWTLVAYTANGGNWLPASIGWPTGIVNKIELRSDSSFTKTIILNSETNSESGTYSIRMYDSKKYVALNYNNKNVLTNKVLQSCANSEALFWTARDTIANLSWKMCDGPDLKYARQK